MSYDMELKDPITKKTLQSQEKHNLKGGTYAIEGTALLELNITYNYSKIFYRVLGNKGIRTIYGMTGRDSIPILQKGVEKLDNDVHTDYWVATEGNAKEALLNLIKLAHLGLDGIWEGD